MSREWLSMFAMIATLFVLIILGLRAAAFEGGRHGGDALAFTARVAPPPGHEPPVEPVELSIAAPTTPDVPGYHGPTLSADQVYGLLLYVSDDPAWADAMLPVVTCESGRAGRYYIGAVSPTGDHGLTQVNATTWYRVIDIARVRRDPVYAIEAGHRIWQQQGYSAWACFGEGE